MQHIPEPPSIWKDRLKAFEDANLRTQYDACLFDMRCWQATEMGFVRYNDGELIKMLMGESHTEKSEGERQTHEWAYNHHTDESLENWGGKINIFKRVERQGLWYMPPFSKKAIWEVRWGKLGHLKRPIPDNIVLRIAELKQLKLFNAFEVFAPVEAWEKEIDIDPIMVACIWEIPLINGKFTTSGKHGYFV